MHSAGCKEHAGAEFAVWMVLGEGQWELNKRWK